MRQKLINPILMWLIVIGGVILVFKFIESSFIIPRNMFTLFLIFPAILYWIYFFGGAILVHRKAPLSVEKIDKLVTSGVYGKVRHPIYSADIVLGWGIFFFYPSTNFFLAVVWLTLILFLWMKMEEKGLIEKFGDEYLEYKKRVPMFWVRFER